ncbi:hypothetical protein HC891_00770 [Candidatus Gracilibacteria bacterium]|nr:hypothetical protein [Candidatus Gracilibacteria bacterium]
MATLHLRQRQFVLACVCVLLLLSTLPLFVSTASALQGNAATNAWEAARQRSSYRFSADVTQLTVPLSTIGNAGRSSRTDRIYLDGRADLRVDRLDMRLWSHGGSTAQTETGLQLQVADGVTRARQGAGPWQEIGDVTGSLAPQGDMLAYLSAVRDLRELGREARAGITFTRYAFTLDGPALASYLRDRLEDDLRASGELPPGMRLQAADHFAKAEGEGEIWIDAQGLPLRQILDLRFPPQGEERVGARIVVDFSDYGPASSFPIDLSVLGQLFATGLIGAGLLIFLPRAYRARRFATALALTLILTLVAGPLLNSLRIRSFLDTQAAQAAERESQQQESDMLQTLRALSSGAPFDPHTDPLAAPAACPAPLPHGQQVVLRAVDDGTDSDGDGLSDFVEERIGTSSDSADEDADGIPDGRDSDGDRISDKIEIDGFTLGGQLWRGDPLAQDSNDDGIADTIEWLTDNDANSLPDDSDGDGTPDVFDTDNDNDGVPDKFDISPQQAARPGDAVSLFGETTPLELQLRDLAADRLTFVDLQLRPSTEDRLWFAQSVLDWPSDLTGQIQDGDGGTYAMVAQNEGRVPEAADYNGDLRLIPMLEVRVAASAALPTQAQLTPYNIVINPIENGERVLYVPLNIVSDQDTGARVAFNGRLPVVADNNNPARIRLVWAVQMLADICKQSANGQCTEYEARNQAQVIQTYYDDWFLTGVSLREDHGTDIAAIYEDPEAPAETDLQNEDTLWLLVNGLDNAFLGARDADSNGQRDLPVSQFAARFDRDQNSTVSEEARWGLDAVLQVETQQYATFDEAVVTTAMTTTGELLERVFSPIWPSGDPTPIMPLILFAREERFRSESLDSIGDAAGYVSMNGPALTFDLQPTGQPASALLTQVGMTWSAYCAEGGADGPEWAACNQEVYWNELERRFAANMAQPGDTADMANGRMVLAQLYFLSLAQGVSRIVERDGAIQAPGYQPLADNATLSLVRSVRNGSAAAISGLLNLVIMARYVDNISVLSYLGRLLKEFRAGTLAQGVSGIGKALIDKLGYKAGITVIALAVTVIVAALVVGAYFLVKYYLAGELGAKIVVAILINAITLVLSIILPIVTVVQWVGALQAAGIGTLTALKNRALGDFGYHRGLEGGRHYRCRCRRARSLGLLHLCHGQQQDRGLQPRVQCRVGRGYSRDDLSNHPGRALCHRGRPDHRRHYRVDRRHSASDLRVGRRRSTQGARPGWSLFHTGDGRH